MSPIRANALTLDIVSRFSALAASRPQDSLLSHLAYALGCSFPRHKIRVVWLPSRSDRNEAGAVWMPEDFSTPIRPMDKVAIQDVVQTRSALEYWHADHRLDYGVHKDNPWVLMVRQKQLGAGRAPCLKREAAELWMCFDSLEPGAETARTDELLDLTQYVEGVKLIYTTFMAPARVSNLMRLSADIMAFSIGTHETFAKRTGKAHRLLRQVMETSGSSDEGFRHVRELSRSVMQGLFSSPLVTSDFTLRRVKSFSRRLRNAAEPFGSKERADIERAAAVLEAATGQAPELCDRSGIVQADASVEWLAEQLMAQWSWCYFAASTTSLDEETWKAAARRTTSDLSQFLWWWSVVGEKKPKEGERAAGEQNYSEVGRLSTVYIPPWLFLWFCQQLLSAEIGQTDERQSASLPGLALTGEKQGSTPSMDGQRSAAEKRRFRADLSYVLRESVRVFLFGRRADYFFQPAMLAKALRTLVEYHVLRVVKLPGKLDICGLLELISQAQPFEAENLAASHLQHVFEVYIAGHFLCTVGLAKAQGGETLTAEGRILGLLAGQGRGLARELRSSDFLKAFSLATLLHTVGRLLFPLWPREIDVFGQLEKGLRDQLRLVQQGLRGSATDLAEACKKELTAAGYLSARNDPEILQWIDDKRERGEADASLLSAWFCHRIGLGVESLSEDVLRQAVRAVLFLRAVTQPIDPENDPVSVLLMLCDELFAWRPTAGGTSVPPGGRRAVKVFSASSPRRYRFRSIDIKQLRFRVESTNSGMQFNAEISMGEHGGRDGFPRVEIELEQPAGAEASSPHAVWLELAQSFMRIQRAAPGNAGSAEPSFRPVVVLRARTSSALKGAGLTCKSLLEELAYEAPLAIRPSLRRWLEVVAPIDIGGDEETIEIRPEGRPLHPQDLSPFLPELDRLADLIIKSRKADRLEALQRQSSRNSLQRARGGAGAARRSASKPDRS